MSHLSCDLFHLILDHLNFTSRCSLSRTCRHLLEIVQDFHLYHNIHDPYFAQLPRSQVIRYLKHARVISIPSQKLIKEKSSYVHHDELSLFPDVPRIIFNHQYSEEKGILSILGWYSFFDPRIGLIPDVMMVDFVGQDTFHLLFNDGTVRWFCENHYITYPGTYTKISGGLALDEQGDVVDLCHFDSQQARPFYVSLPPVVDFAIENLDTRNSCDHINYITRTGEAYYSGEITMKLVDDAKKILCYGSTTFVLTKDQRLHLFMKGIVQTSFFVENVLDVYRRHVYEEEIEIVAIVREHHIVHLFHDEEDFEVSFQPRLYQELEMIHCKYVVEY